MRTASLLEYFAARSAVDLALFAEEGAIDPAQAIPASLVRQSWTVRLPRHSRTPLARVARNAVRYLGARPPLVDRFASLDQTLSAALRGRRYDFAILEHFWMAPYVNLVQGHCDKVWLDLHNVESVWHETLADAETGLVRVALRRFAGACRELERRLFPLFSGILVPGPEDAERIREPAADTPIVVYPNALPWMEAPERAEDNVIIFTGNLEYAPNRNAVRWFAREVWPEVRRRCPHLVWRIGGRGAECIQSLVGSDSRVELIGPMENAIAEIARARIAVVPLQAGSGTRFKILEAWASATPVVSSSIGAQGLGAEHGRSILIADAPGEMQETIVNLLASESRRRAIGDAGRRLYEARFTWPAAWQALAGVVC